MNTFKVDGSTMRAHWNKFLATSWPKTSLMFAIIHVIYTCDVGECNYVLSSIGNVIDGVHKASSCV